MAGMEQLLLRVLIACTLWTLVWGWLAWRRRFRFGVLPLMCLVAGYAIALGMATESLRIEGRHLQAGLGKNRWVERVLMCTFLSRSN
jgi:hypothetical protein